MIDVFSGTKVDIDVGAPGHRLKIEIDLAVMPLDQQRAVVNQVIALFPEASITVAATGYGAAFSDCCAWC